jgi:hypothetical protein
MSRAGKCSAVGARPDQRVRIRRVRAAAPGAGQPEDGMLGRGGGTPRVRRWTRPSDVDCTGRESNPVRLDELQHMRASRASVAAPDSVGRRAGWRPVPGL